jgi:hypothetical protein
MKLYNLLEEENNNYMNTFQNFISTHAVVVVAFPSVIIASSMILAEFYSNLYSLIWEWKNQEKLKLL